MFLYGDMDRGLDLSAVSKQIQHEILCSMDTPLIQVSYRIEVQVCHEGAFGNANNEVPGVFFPFVITRDAKGALDLGTQGHVSSQMIEQYSQQSSVGQPVDIPDFKPVHAGEDPTTGYGGYFDPTQEQPGSYPVLGQPVDQSYAPVVQPSLAQFSVVNTS